MRGLVIALHDVAPATAGESAHWRDLVAERTPGPVSLLVVPRYHGGPGWRAGPGVRWLRERDAAGDEPVLHGYAHLDRAGHDGAELRGRPPRDIGARVREGRASSPRRVSTPAGSSRPRTRTRQRRTRRAGRRASPGGPRASRSADPARPARCRASAWAPRRPSSAGSRRPRPAPPPARSSTRRSSASTCTPPTCATRCSRGRASSCSTSSSHRAGAL